MNCEDSDHQLSNAANVSSKHGHKIKNDDLEKSQSSDSAKVTEGKPKGKYSVGPPKGTKASKLREEASPSKPDLRAPKGKQKGKSGIPKDKGTMKPTVTTDASTENEENTASDDAEAIDATVTTDASIEEAEVSAPDAGAEVQELKDDSIGKAEITDPKDQPKQDIPPNQMNCTHDLRILLVGRTGCGKSATGNSLLGITKQEGFIDATSLISVTKEYKRKIKQRYGRTLEVVDTPGIFDTSFNDETVHQQIEQCLKLTLPGFNAICLVLTPDRFTKEIVETVDICFKSFGKGVDEYAFIIVTHIATEEDMINFIKTGETKPEDETDNKDEGKKAFQALRKRCKDKLLFIDNNASEDRKDEMVRTILTAIDTANANSSRLYFQNSMTRRIEHTVFGLEGSIKDLRILLIGLPGHGKSATVNSLLGKSMFIADTANSCQQIQIGETNGHNVFIVEFQVNNPPCQSDKYLKKQLLQTENMLHTGLHAVCFVIDPNRIAELKDQFQPIMEYFGDEANDYAFVIMTFTKNEDELEKHFPNNLEEQHPEVTHVLRFCKQKKLYIDNKVSQTEREDMIKDMVIFIESENANKCIPYFSSCFKQQFESARLGKASKEAKGTRANEADDALKKAKSKREAETKNAARAVDAARTVKDKKVAEAKQAFATVSPSERKAKAEREAKAARAAKAAVAARKSELERVAEADKADTAAEAAKKAKDEKVAEAEKTARAAEAAKEVEAERVSEAEKAAKAAEAAKKTRVERVAEAERAARAAVAAKKVETEKVAEAEKAARTAEIAKKFRAEKDEAEKAATADDDSIKDIDKRMDEAERAAKDAQAAEDALQDRLREREAAIEAYKRETEEESSACSIL